MFNAYITDKGYQMIAAAPETHVVNIHMPNGTFAVCYKKVGPKTMGAVLTIAKLDRGAPQIRYVSPLYTGTLIGPEKLSRAMEVVVSEARIQLAKDGYLVSTLEGVQPGYTAPA